MTSKGKAYKTENIKAPFSQLSLVSQVCPVIMNCEQTLGVVAADVDFIASANANGVPTGMLGTELVQMKSAGLILLGRVVNTFLGHNYLDCTVVTDNQWQINVDGGAYVDLQNGVKADGRMLDTDWECYFQGIIHPFTLMFDVTGLVTVLTNMFGIRLGNGRSIQNNLIVTVDVYMRYVWELPVG